MHVSEAIEQLLADNAIVVVDKTFEPTSIEALRLETGDMMYWVADGGDIWLSLDPDSEEVILFSEIEGEFDASEDTIVYNGEDYEFSYEGEGTVIEEGEDIDTILFRDFEGPDGRILRVAEYTVNSEIIAALGRKVPEEDLQEA